MAIKEYRGVIDDGTREVPLYNKFGKLICNIYIRPSDLSILDRYNQLTTDFKDIVKPLERLHLKDDGTVTFEDEWAVLKEVEAELKQRFNALFDMDEADAIFATRNPFYDVGNGRFYSQNVLEVIGNIIMEAIEDEMKESKERTDPYLNDIQPQPTETEVSDDDRTASTKS